jgi:protein-tyrosine phosphatase
LLNDGGGQEGVQVFGDGFEIVFVCHANLCRSPMAERLTRRAFEEAFGPAASGVTVSSAGTHAYAGSAMHQASSAVLAECGIDATGFSTRTVNASVLASADLVLTAEREQRAACVTTAPETVRRAFTLRQFARLAEAVPPVTPLAATVPARLSDLVAQVNANRHLVPAGAVEMDDLADPVSQPIEAFWDCAQEIWRSVTTIVQVISGP